MKRVGIGKVKLALDDEYGQLRPPFKVDPWEVSRVPRSKCELNQSVGNSLSEMHKVSQSQLFRHAARTLTYIWAMDDAGTVQIAVEELAEMPDGTKVEGYPRRRNFPVHPSEEKKLGHPTLLNGGLARAAGELFLDEIDGNLFWFVNVSSGRYCRITPPTKDHVDNLVKRFRELVQDDVQLDDISVG